MLICKIKPFKHILNIIITSWNIQRKESMKFNFKKTPKYNAHAKYFYDFLLSRLSWIEEMRQSIKTHLLTILRHLEGTHKTKRKKYKNLPSSSPKVFGGTCLAFLPLSRKNQTISPFMPFLPQLKQLQVPTRHFL